MSAVQCCRWWAHISMYMQMCWHVLVSSAQQQAGSHCADKERSLVQQQPQRCRAHLQPARVSGTRARGSVIWLPSSRTTMSKAWPSSTGSEDEQQVRPTMLALLSSFLRLRSAPAWTCRRALLALPG